ncbi:MAG: hypothetical protein ABEI77_06645 [Halorientalis sp.]
MSTWNVEVDEDKERVYLTIHGKMEPEEMSQLADQCGEAARRLPDGFDLVNDMATFVPSSEETMAQIQRGKRLLAENGMGAAVRVVSESTTGQMQFDRAGEGVETYSLAKAESIEQAEKLLDKR